MRYPGFVLVLMSSTNMVTKFVATIEGMSIFKSNLSNKDIDDMVSEVMAPKIKMD